MEQQRQASMASIDLNDYYYVVHVVEKGGFTRASESLGIDTEVTTEQTHRAAREAPGCEPYSTNNSSVEHH